MKIAGKEINKWYLIGGGAAVVGGYVYWKRQANASAAANAAGSPASATAIDPLTGMPYSQDSTIDPVTGMTYLQEAQQYGSVSAAEAALSSGASGYGGPGGYGGYGGSTGTTPTPSGQTYTTNAQWAQAVTAGLVSLGYSSTDVASALGLYFQAHPLSATQAGIIQVAVAEFGPPPVGTYQIITQPGPQPGGSITGLKATAAFDNVSASWSPVTGATSYEVIVTTHMGAKQLGSATSTTPTARVSYLPQKTDIAVHVTAQPGGQTGVVYTRTQ